jgi:hypothetical protein
MAGVSGLSRLNKAKKLETSFHERKSPAGRRGL